MKFQFDNRLTNELPEDTLAAQGHMQPRLVQHAVWSATQPAAVAAPRLLAHSVDVAAMLGLSESDVRSDAFLQAFSGNQLVDGMQPFSTCYGGHQFGHWAGQLGDGRAISLGEVVHDGQRFELQLKGAGPTPYSRSADGRAVLRSSLREFLCSEAMHHLGVPTTRALSLMTTGESVLRDMFYDGHAADEPGAIVCRVAPSFIRFGHFEIFAQREDERTLRELVTFCIDRDFPHITGSADEKFAQWFKAICERTALLVNEWLRVGFVHGVMNTDNMSVLGLTIDYGPYGWVDNYDYAWTPNTTDANGKRYAFGRQAGVARWNLQKLAAALVLVAPSQASLMDGLDAFDALYNQQLGATLAAKLGMLDFGESDDALVNELFAWMQQSNIDYTEFFRALANLKSSETADQAWQKIHDAFYQPELLTAQQDSVLDWLNRYLNRIVSQNNSSDADTDCARQTRMNATNPRFILRNYLAQQAIDAAEQGDLSMLHELQVALRTPYAEHESLKHLYAKRPDWALNKAGCSMLSCSS